MVTRQRMPEGAMAPATLASDLHTLHAILQTFFAGIGPAAWSNHTEQGGRGWTLHQTLAHITAWAEIYDNAVEATLADKPFSYPGLKERADLSTLNAHDIAAREAVAPETLVENFLSALTRTADRIASLGPADLLKPGPKFTYNRPITLAEIAGAQLIHPGITHAAQLANGAGVPPLWARYDPPLMRRQLTRFFHIMSAAYWPERGGLLYASVNYRIFGPGGGSWYVVMAPDGGRAGEGKARYPVLRVYAPSADAFCRVSTLQVSPARALLTGKLVALGSVGLGLRLPSLFLPEG